MSAGSRRQAPIGERHTCTVHVVSASGSDPVVSGTTECHSVKAFRTRDEDLRRAVKSATTKLEGALQAARASGKADARRAKEAEEKARIAAEGEADAKLAAASTSAAAKEASALAAAAAAAAKADAAAKAKRALEAADADKAKSKRALEAADADKAAAKAKRALFAAAASAKAAAAKAAAANAASAKAEESSPTNWTLVTAAERAAWPREPYPVYMRGFYKLYMEKDSDAIRVKVMTKRIQRFGGKSGAWKGQKNNVAFDTMMSSDRIFRWTGEAVGMAAFDQE